MTVSLAAEDALAARCWGISDGGCCSGALCVVADSNRESKGIFISSLAVEYLVAAKFESDGLLREISLQELLRAGLTAGGLLGRTQGNIGQKAATCESSLRNRSQKPVVGIASDICAARRSAFDGNHQMRVAETGHQHTSEERPWKDVRAKNERAVSNRLRTRVASCGALLGESGLMSSLLAVMTSLVKALLLAVTAERLSADWLVKWLLSAICFVPIALCKRLACMAPGNCA